MNPHQVKLPDGWMMYPWCEVWVLTRGDGCVSVDFKKRSFAPGNASVYTDESDKYTGRGWKQRLVDDAIKYLEAL